MNPCDEKIYGRRRAEVIDINHPEKLMKAKIRLLGQWEDVNETNLPWAEYGLPIGARENMGSFSPCDVGDLVWVEFDAGDTRVPIIVGSVFYAPNSVPNLPQESFAGPKSVNIPERPKTKDGDPFPVIHPPAYAEDYVISEYGILVQLMSPRDGKENGTFRITHKESGSNIELTEDGNIVIQAEKDFYRSIKGHKHDVITQNQVVIIKGDYTIDVTGNVNINADKDVTVHAKGNATVKSDKVTALQGDSIDINGANGVKISSGAALDLKGGAGMNIDAGGPFSAKAAKADWILG